MIRGHKTAAFLLVVTLAALAQAGAAAEPLDAVDRLPYKITAFVAIAPETRIDARGREDLLAAWRGLAHRFVGAPWALTIAEADRTVAGVDLEASEAGAFADLAPEADKLWLVQVGRDRDGSALTLTGRELDTATHRLGPTYRRVERFPIDLPRALLGLALEVFRPTAAIGETSGGGVALTVRGASLRAASPAGQVVKAGTVFRPIRSVTLPDGTQRLLDIPFTYLRVDSLDGPVAHCAIVSALREPLTRRIAQKSTLTALASKPGPEPTRLRFVTAADKASATATASASAPAAGYRLTVRPLPDGLVREVGTTDREGRLVLPPGQFDGLIAIRLLAGNVEPLVEFILMPGESPNERTLPPFDPLPLTLALETQLDSLRDSVIDLVAVRARLEARLKARFDGEDWAGAEETLKEFYRLPSRETFAARLAKLKDDAAAQQARTKTAVLTRTAQAQVAEVDGLIARYLDDDAFRAYADGLAKARSDAADRSRAAAKAKTRAKPAGTRK